VPNLTHEVRRTLRAGRGRGDGNKVRTARIGAIGSLIFGRRTEGAESPPPRDEAPHDGRRECNPSCGRRVYISTSR
jgi:hypothetical protein